MVVVLVGVMAAMRGRKPEVAPEQIDKVTLQRGEKSITLTRQGTLTVKVPEGTFQQQWNEERVRAFFTQFESEDFSRFEETASTDTVVEGYVLTITREDGSSSTYIIPISIIDIPEVIEELIETFEEVTSNVPTLTPTAVPTQPQYYYQPTSIPTQPPIVYPTLTPTRAPDGGNGTGGSEQQQFECEFYDPEKNPDIISETVCTPE